jgi:hypothetical protein
LSSFTNKKNFDILIFTNGGLMRLKNKKITDPELTRSFGADYKALIFSALDDIKPRSGTVAMRKHFKIMDKIESIEPGEFISLSEDDFNIIKERFSSLMSKAIKARRELVRFEDDLNEAMIENHQDS